MGRPSEGWQLKRPEGRRCWSVMFTHAGKRYNLGTGEEAEDAAARAAATIYAETLTGKRTPRKRGTVDARPLGPASVAWLNDIAGSLSRPTCVEYGRYVRAYFLKFFPTVEAISRPAVSNYITKRLRAAGAETVSKEVGALRGLYAHALGIDRRAVDFPLIPSRAVGTPQKRGKRTRTPLSPDEATAIVRAMPRLRTHVVKGPDRRTGLYCFRAPVRARCIVSYETSLRPATLDAISVPEHYTKGSTTLRISADIDKARFGREVPLSAGARAELDAICPAVGLIFGKFRNRKALRNAARAVGLAEHRIATLHPYDLRAARLTHWAEDGNLPGVQWLAGHKRMSTTAIYAQGSLRSAEAVLASRIHGDAAE